MKVTGMVKFFDFRWVAPVAGLILLGSVGLVAFVLVRAQVAAAVYERRLQVLVDDYSRLRENYNAAVRKTAITELLVRDGTLSVRVRTAVGVLRQIDTPYSPEHEIYVDYIVVDGRLWIRRVFDSRTAPDQGTVIDPEREVIDWSDQAVDHGKAVYRKLDEGCWVITVTGSGALGLAKSPARLDDRLLAPPPPVGEFAEALDEARRAADGVGLGEVLAHLFGRRAK